MTLDTDRVRKALLDPERISTHWDGCEYAHVRCALARALDEIDRMRADAKRCAQVPPRH